MSKPTLTDPVVKALVASDKPFIRFCGQLPGFGVVVRPTGSKSFIVQYDFGGRKGETRKVTIGRFPTVKAADARKEAQKILSQVKLGTDVAAAKSKKRAELTVAELCDEYMKDGCVGKKASTIATDKGRIERHIKPLLGKKRIGDVEKSDVQRLLSDIARGKTAVDEKTKKHGRARVTGGEGAATRTVRLLGGIFTYAVDRKYIATNPRHGVKLFKDGKGERFLSPEELARLSDALHEAETVGLPWQLSDGPNSKHRPHKGGDQREVVSPYAVAAIRLLLFTGCRAGEVLNLMWADVDGLNGLLHIRDSKTGAKKVPLTAPAMAVLSELPRSGNYVIAGSAPDKPRSDLKRPWKRITDHANLPGLRIHDLRHSFASAGAASGMGLAMVGKLLGHASPATTARYAHFADNAAQAAANSIANSIAAHMRGSVATDNVVDLKVKDGSNG